MIVTVSPERRTLCCNSSEVSDSLFQKTAKQASEILLVESEFNHREPRSLKNPFLLNTKQSLFKLLAALPAYSNSFASNPSLGQADSDSIEARVTFFNVPIKAPVKSLEVFAPWRETNTDASIKNVVIMGVRLLIIVTFWDF
jgi:hypothetical protein